MIESWNPSGDKSRSSAKLSSNYVILNSIPCSRLEHGIRSGLLAWVAKMAQKSMNIIGKRVKQARLRRNPSLTQDELSGQLARLGVAVDRAGISKIEIGARCVLDYEVKALAKVLGVSAGWLLDDKR